MEGQAEVVLYSEGEYAAAVLYIILLLLVQYIFSLQQFQVSHLY